MQAIVGTVIHSISFGTLEVLKRGAIVVAEGGLIHRVIDLSTTAAGTDIKATLGSDVTSVIDYGSKLLIPGFIDTHCHAPQYVFSGIGMDLPLLEWLEKYTFPCESRFKDNEFAKKSYSRAVKRHLSYGSTCCSYFATIHNDAALILADVTLDLGQRAFVGKVSMDRNSPDYYIEKTEQGCTDAEEFARKVLKKTKTGSEFLASVDSATSEPAFDCNYKFYSNPTLLNKPDITPLVMPVVTPRFVPTCTSQMMSELGRISRKYGLPVQSHLSESKGEIAWVAELHPECTSYAEVYKAYGLLHDASYMAHCVHSDDAEVKLLSDTGCGVSHCASSNFNLCSGVMNIRKHMKGGVKMSIGTDVAGGHSPSMLDAIRQSIVASTVTSFNMGDDLAKPLSYQEAFHLATVGGAKVLGMDNVLGNFQTGKKADILVVDGHCDDSPFDVFEGEEEMEIFQKFLFLGDNRNIKTIFVDGKKVLEQL
jgi:guanine deaminase